MKIWYQNFQKKFFWDLSRNLILNLMIGGCMNVELFVQTTEKESGVPAYLIMSTVISFLIFFGYLTLLIPPLVLLYGNDGFWKFTTSEYKKSKNTNPSFSDIFKHLYEFWIGIRDFCLSLVLVFMYRWKYIQSLLISLFYIIPYLYSVLNKKYFLKNSKGLSITQKNEELLGIFIGILSFFTNHVTILFLFVLILVSYINAITEIIFMVHFKTKEMIQKFKCIEPVLEFRKFEEEEKEVIKKKRLNQI